MVDKEKQSSLKKFEKRVFSGVQPTGGLTLGKLLRSS
jgi:tryptophanyl-tRNA synthetase